ncbi:MAG: hypothetical protein AB7R40_23265 [Nitrospiraceae bacterium]
MPEQTNRWPHLAPYQRPPDYIGATYPGTFVVYGIHRDSDIVERSNWAELEARFGERPGVFITRASHWAVGWVDTMRVDPTEASEDTLDEIEAQLARLDDYPVLNEMRLGEMEWTEAYDYWASMSVSERVYWCQRARVSIFAARRADEIPEEVYEYMRPD